MKEKKAIFFETQRLHDIIRELTEAHMQVFQEKESIINEAHAFVMQQTEHIRAEAQQALQREEQRIQNNAESEIKTQLAVVDQLKRNITHLESKLAKKEKNSAQEAQETSELTSDLSKLLITKGESDKKEAKIRGFDAERSSLEATIKEMKNQLAQKESLIEHINKERTKIAQRHNRIKEDHAKSDSLLARLHKEKDELQAKSDGVKEDNAQLLKQAQQAGAQMKTLEGRIVELETFLEGRGLKGDIEMTGAVKPAATEGNTSNTTKPAPSSSKRPAEANAVNNCIDPILYVSCLHFIAATIHKEVGDGGASHTDLIDTIKRRFQAKPEAGCSKDIEKLVNVLFGWGCKQTGGGEAALASQRPAGPLPSPLEIWTDLPPLGGVVDSTKFLSETYNGRYRLPADRMDIFRLINLVASSRGKEIGRKF